MDINDVRKDMQEKIALGRAEYNRPKIARKDLIVGKYYKGHCRNAEEARWNGEVFIHWRTKFGNTFLEEIKHPEDEQHFDVFVVEELLDNPTKEIPLGVNLG